MPDAVPRHPRSVGEGRISPVELQPLRGLPGSYRMVDYARPPENSYGLHAAAGERGYQPLRHLHPGRPIQEGTAMHIADLNLAGLATLAFLVLFLPSTGLIHRRARAIAARRSQADQRRQLERLIVEEAVKVTAAEVCHEKHV